MDATIVIALGSLMVIILGLAGVAMLQLRTEKKIDTVSHQTNSGMEELRNDVREAQRELRQVVAEMAKSEMARAVLESEARQREPGQTEGQ